MDGRILNDLGQLDPEDKMHLDSGVDRVGVFVHRDRYIWVLDLMDHFHQDETINVAEDKIDDVPFRSGVTVLTDETFERYLALEQPYILTHHCMRSCLLSDAPPPAQLAELIEKKERAINNDEWFPLPTKGMLRGACIILPRFYINFEEKLFMHTHFDRPHEIYVSSDWTGVYVEDSFYDRLPLSERWWVIDGCDYGVMMKYF